MNVKITALAPLHFSGSPFAVCPLEYAFLNNKLYVLDDTALLAAVKEKGATDEFMEWLQLPAEKRDLSSFLRRRGMLKPDVLDVVAKYSMSCRVPPEGELRPLPRLADGRPYLPASAVKGALRVGVAYGLFKAMPERTREDLLYGYVADELERFRRHPLSREFWFQQRFRETLANRLDEGLFQRFRLSEEGGRPGPNMDVFRVLRVVDSAPVEPGAVSICPVRIYSAGARTGPKPWSIPSECIWTGATFELGVHVREDLLAQFERFNADTSYGLPFATVAEMLRKPFDAAASMAKDLYAHEQQFLARELAMPKALDLRGQEPTLRLGWGTTMLGTSVSLLLPEGLRAELRNVLYEDRGRSPAPKSRKLVEMGGNVFSMGWARAEAEMVDG